MACYEGRRKEEMMQIVTDSASLYSPEDGNKLGFTVIPACAIMNGNVYRDFVDIDSDEFLKLIHEGGIPTSSQPAIGEVMETLKDRGEEILFLSIGDGLSGAYENAVGVKNSIEDNEYIHIVDTKTLAGPQRYFVKKAMKLREEGVTIEKIKKDLEKCIETSVSFVIPVDFNFLKRSGRLTPIAAKIGGLIKLVPVMTQTEDKRKIAPFVIKRSTKKAVEAIINHLKSLGVDENYIISIGHGGADEKANDILQQMKQHFANTMIEILKLSPALITHGGPGCITIQAVRK